jgi:hypothetical protein
MKKLFAAMLFLFCSCAYGQNAVTDGAAIVQPAVNNPPKPPAIQIVLRATIQLAVYDAAMAIQGGFEPYAAAISAPVGADVRAAVATAAYLTARARVAASQVPYLDTQYSAYMAAIADGQAKSDGVLVGEIAATAILAVRLNDGLSNVVLYQCSSNPPPAGEFEPDGGCGTQPVGVNIGQIIPFTFSDASHFRPDGPNPLTSNRLHRGLHRDS